MFAVDLVDPNNNDGKLTSGEMFRVDDFNEVVEVRLDGVADLNFALAVDMNGIDFFPSIRTNFGLDWSLGLGTGITKPIVQFTDVEMNLGQFFGGFVGPILGQVQDVLEPVQPVIDVLAGPLPVISDLAGMKISAIDLGKLYGGTAKVAGFLDGVAQIVTLVNALPDVDTSEWLNVGGFRYDINVNEIVEVFGPAKAVFDRVREVASSFDPSELTGDGGGRDDEFHLDFPVLTNPRLLFDLMLGKDVDLFTLELPRFEFDATIRQFYPIPAFPVLGAELRGSIGAEIDLAFGYDSTGLRRYFNTGSKTSVADGFFLFDHENADGTGDDIPELTLSAGISAGPAVQLAAASVTVQGGIFADVFFDLHDNNEDGKIRGLELLDNALLDNSLIHIFDVSGALDARLYAALEIGTGIFKVSKSFSLAEVELLSYDFPRPDGNAVPLAEEIGSVLHLNVGPRASLRHHPLIDLLDPDHDEDNNEQVMIAAGTEPGTVVVTMLGREQTYRGITRIVGDAGLGNDSIHIHESLTIPVEIYGGPGSDTIRGGSGNDRIFGDRSDHAYYSSLSASVLADGPNEIDGGDGNDILVGGFVADVLRGSDGNDEIRGGDGADLIEGGEGHDSIWGQAGRDVLLGGGGNDVLRGGDGQDLLEGASGSDVLFGGAGADRLVGGRDQDTLHGDSGDDVLLGNEGADWISGGTGRDIVFGGVGNDTIFGGAGDDQLFGENSRDAIYGDEGDDLIVGGLASDDLFGGLGNDRIFATDQDGTDDAATHRIHGGGGNDIIVGGNLADRLYGDGQNDALGTVDPTTDGDDVIEALGGNDVVIAGGGDDRVLGGAGADDLWGGPGDDRLYATNEFDAPDPANTFGAMMVGGGGNDVRRAQIGVGLDLSDVIFGDGPSSPDADAPGDNSPVGPDPAKDGDDVIHAFQGSDWIDAGNGNNTVFAGEGDDRVVAGVGDDWIDGGSGSDWIEAGLGNDKIIGGDGNDVLFGGVAIGTRESFDLANPANFVAPPKFEANEASYPTGYAGADVDGIARFLFPAIITGSVLGVPGDGRDNIEGGGGVDFLFGGFDVDVLDGGDGPDFVDAGGGSDLKVSGGGGDDIVLGGWGDDAVQGGTGIDQVYGNEGDDVVFGEPAGSSQIDVLGQRLYGGDGRDQLFAFAPQAASSIAGEQLFGGAGGDFLRGNRLNEVLVGGSGDDFLHGDILDGPKFLVNVRADLEGGDDLLLGNSGEDQLFGGGGDDTIWGGSDTDMIEGQAGADIQYGGSGIDLFFAPTGIGQSDPAQLDTIDGHFGNSERGDIEEDQATDILVINGTPDDDTIVLSQSSNGQLHVSHPNGNFDVNWIDSDSHPLIEQFQIAGLGGDDRLGFATAEILPGLEAFAVPAGFEPLDLSRLAARSRDFVGVFDGNSGNDLLVGADARDRLDGGRGSDVQYGFAGDDRLWGDGGDGLASDHDVLFAGQGNDDLIGGSGRNSLLAWSFAPDSRLIPTAGSGFSPGDIADFLAAGPDAEFGVFVDPQGVLHPNRGNENDEKEITGLNRIVGGSRDDFLFGGTALDFLYGNGGNDTLVRSDGSPLTSLDGGLAGDEWKQYARESDQVWYVGGTNANDEITVDFVTEPGVLADHHLITRLTDNNGNVSFAAQVRLDFDATDGQGNRVWDEQDVVVGAAARIASLDALGSADANTSDEQRADALAGIGESTTALHDALLPREGDFLAIIIDALGGNDQITVGPTVQKSVWIDAGAGDDRVLVRGGNPILVDRAESSQSAAGLRGRNDTTAYTFDLFRAQRWDTPLVRRRTHRRRRDLPRADYRQSSRRRLVRFSARRRHRLKFRCRDRDRQWFAD